MGSSFGIFGIFALIIQPIHAESVFERYKELQKECLDPGFSKVQCIYEPSESPMTEVGSIQKTGAVAVDYWAEKGNSLKERVLGLKNKYWNSDDPQYWDELASERLFERLKIRMKRKADQENLKDCQRVCLAQCISSRLFPIDGLERKDDESEKDRNRAETAGGDEWYKIVLMKKSKREAIQDLEGLCVERSKIAVDLILELGVDAQSIYGVRTESTDPETGEATPYPFWNFGARHELPRVIIAGKSHYIDPALKMSLPNSFCFFSNTDPGPKVNSDTYRVYLENTE